MKRIYTLLALVCLGATSTFAQKSIDLQAVIQFPMDGATISPGTSLDTSKVLAGIFFWGPGDIVTGTDAVFFMTSLSTPADSALTYLDGVVWGQDLLGDTDTGLVFVFPNANEIGAGHSGPFTLTSDSIRGLYDWDQWNLNDSIVLIRPPYENGKSYGFFFRAVRVGDQATGDPIAEDPDMSNNRAVQRIVWSSSSNINELFAKKDKAEINVYPNPAKNEVRFKFDFAGPSHATATITDVTGKIVSMRNFGRTLKGTQEFSIDISSLSAGNYILQFNTDEQYAVSKFTVKR